MLEAGSTPSTLAPNSDNGSKSTPSLHPISKMFLFSILYLTFSMLANSLKCFDSPTDDLYL